MTKNHLELSEDQFDRMFPLVPNHINASASWALGEGRGCLFETYGDELEFVKRQDPRRVWTLVDGDDGDMYLINGFHRVNRVGYLISRYPVPEGTTVQVRLPMPIEEEDHVDAG